MAKRTRPIVLTAAGAALTVLAVGCGSSGSPASSGATSAAASLSTVTIDIGGPVTSLDPAKGGAVQDFTAAAALYDPLVNFDSRGQIIPGLATSWTTTASSATFHIRSGVTCSDGTPLTPSDVAASLRRYTAPATAAPLLGQTIGAGNTAQVTADAGAGTVTIVLAHPWSQLLAGLTSPYTGIVCPAGLKDPASLLTHSDGTGAYVAGSQVAGASYTFSRRAGYDWGAAYPGQPAGTAPQTLVLKVVPDDNTAANLISTGGLDIGTFQSTDWTRFHGSGYRLVTQPLADTMLLFNETPGLPTARQPVRLAIAETISHAAITNVLGNGHGVAESNIGQSSYQCYDPSLASLAPAYTPSAAAATLKGLSIRIVGTTLLAGGNGTSYLLAALNQAGAIATLQNMTNDAWVADLLSGKNDWDVTILADANTSFSLLAAAPFLIGPQPPHGQNLGDVQNPAAAAAFQQAATLPGAAGCGATSRMQSALLKRDDVVPLAAEPNTAVFATGTSGVMVAGLVEPASIRVAG